MYDANFTLISKLVLTKRSFVSSLAEKSVQYKLLGIFLSRQCNIMLHRCDWILLDSPPPSTTYFLPEGL